MGKKKNSIIELLRFIFAFNVVKNHGFFPYQGSLFGPARISVEFFFILSGYLFVKTLEKYRDGNVGKNILCLYKNKTVSLGIPLYVALCCNIAYNITTGFNTISILSYLWYVHDMLIVFASFIVVRKIVKRDDVFWFIILIVGMIASVFHTIDMFYSSGYFRAFSAISIGMLITRIPKLKNEKAIPFIGFTISAIIVIRMLFCSFTRAEEELLIICIYPALIYFAFNIEYKNKIFDYLGSLSFGLYAFQCVTRLINVLGYKNRLIDFIIIVFCTVTSNIFTTLINRRKQLIKETI